MAHLPTFTDLSHELLCHILQYLPLKEVLSVAMLCRKLSVAVDMHLRLRKYIDFCEDKIYGYMPSTITDDNMHSLFKKCPHLETVYGLHPLKVERRRLRKRSALTVPGIIEALSLCCSLKAVETSDLRLLEAIMQSLPKIEIIGHFRNRDGVFPPNASQRLKLNPYPRITSLHLVGVEVPELTAMPRLEHLHLQCVRFTKLQPFRAFLAQNLRTFVMKHCMGPTLALRYLSLIIALSSSPSLSRLELVRVPLPGGLFQRAVEDSYRHNGFVNLETLVISGCKGVMEADLGHLMIVASKKLESLSIQPSLTRDSLFVSLSFAQCEFPKLKNIHLGFMDKLNAPEEWSNDVLLSLGLAEVPDTPSSLTDSGMKVISQLFPNIQSLSVSNCPHLMAMDQWSPRAEEGEPAWKELTDLTLQRCHCLQLPSFALFLAFLPQIKVVILNDMFREPPKGCSHVGLSAGTGLGMSSAVVSNQDEHIAVQGHQQDFELQADELVENEELDRDFLEVDNEDNPDQHIMVLQQEFFDDERRIVPPPVRHREDIIENGDMPQNDPENRIRRELNDDYNVALMQVSDMENSSPSVEENGDNVNQFDEGEVVEKASLDQEVDEPEDKNEVKKESSDDGPHSSKKKCLKSSSSEADCKESDQAARTEGRKKKVVTFENSCDHSQECWNNCSKGFDPNQPSTSRDGNCLHCTCPDDAFAPEPMEEDPSPKTKDINTSSGASSSGDGPSKKRKSAKSGEASGSKHFKKDPDSNDDLVKQEESGRNITVKVEEDNVEAADDVFKGPLTRNRKKVMDADVSKPSTSSSNHSVKSVDDHRDDSASTSAPNKKKKSAKPENQNITPKETRSSSRAKSQPSESEPPLEPKESEDNKTNPKSEEDNSKNKKHKKHRHRKCKRKKCDKQCHKHYPLTRSGRNRFLREDYNAVSQGTQATSADIRRTLRKQRGCSNRCRRRCGSSHRRSHNHISARQQFKRRNKRRTNAEFSNKSTSTSDPLMEDDAVQTLRLVSETLVSLTIISCGISDVVIDHCQSLRHVEVQACRILKLFQLHYSPSLKRLNISQCPKLSLEVLIPEVMLLEAARRILVCFEPCMQSYDPAETEKLLFSKTPLDHSVMLFHDFDNANEGLQASTKEKLYRWMEEVHSLYFTLTHSLFYTTRIRRKMTNSRESRSKFPYGHNFRRIHGGCFQKGAYPFPSDDVTATPRNYYQILTNDHVFASSLENASLDDDFPSPEYDSYMIYDKCLRYSMLVHDFTEKKIRVMKKIMAFYIPVSKNNLAE
ncbi:hypothetical protein JTE90_016649 [Oedothorax gibbosus]|uniref:F-box domain-containing protein n=1 Tax=Oedothorax gibbosus TaxID=931172 RepID=A0AAV6V3R3_9ARAC|nr:hypothetical protein JTE90_016649 [Oedothorax gibbosus]